MAEAALKRAGFSDARLQQLRKRSRTGDVMDGIRRTPAAAAALASGPGGFAVQRALMLAKLKPWAVEHKQSAVPYQLCRVELAHVESGDAFYLFHAFGVSLDACKALGAHLGRAATPEQAAFAFAMSELRKRGGSMPKRELDALMQSNGLRLHRAYPGADEWLRDNPLRDADLRARSYGEACAELRDQWNGVKYVRHKETLARSIAAAGDVYEIARDVRGLAREIFRLHERAPKN